MIRRRHRAALGAGLRSLLAALVLTGCSAGEPAPERLLYSIQGSTFGTYYVVKVVQDAATAPEGSPEERLVEMVEEELAEVDALLSNYRDDSELSRFNAAPAGEPFPVSPPPSSSAAPPAVPSTSPSRRWSRPGDSDRPRSRRRCRATSNCPRSWGASVSTACAWTDQRRR